MEHIYFEPQFGENWFTYADLYTQVVNKFSSGSKFVEVGSWKGKSASYMCVEIANSQKHIEFFCVDHFLGSVEHQIGSEFYTQDIHNLFDIFTENMKPVENFYKPMKMSSIEASKMFENNSLDFVFIDASHEYQDVKNDIIAWLPKIKNGGIISGHDYTHPPVNIAVNEVLNDLILPSLRMNCWIYGVA